MMGMDYLRLNRILAKPRDLPELTQYDRRLLRFVVRGAIAYIAAVILLNTFTDLPSYDFEYFVLFFMVLPIGLLFVLWWTTDVAPLFARVSIIVLSVLGIIISLLLVVAAPSPERYLFVFLTAYLLAVAGESRGQIHRAGARFSET